MNSAIHNVVGGVFGLDPPVPVDARAPAALPDGAVGFAVPQGPGDHALMVLLPQDVELDQGEGGRRDTVALVPSGGEFRLVGSGGPSPKLRYENCAVRATAGDLRADRCDLCHEPFVSSENVRRCTGCGRVLCEDLCSSAGCCPRCNTSLGAWGEEP